MKWLRENAAWLLTLAAVLVGYGQQTARLNAVAEDVRIIKTELIGKGLADGSPIEQLRQTGLMPMTVDTSNPGDYVKRCQIEEVNRIHGPRTRLKNLFLVAESSQ